MKRNTYISPWADWVEMKFEANFAASMGGSAPGYGSGGNMFDDSSDFGGTAGGYGDGNDMFG